MSMREGETIGAGRRLHYVMLRSIVASAALLMAAGCTGIGSGASPAATPTDEPASARVTCGGGPSFGLAALDQPGGAELDDDPASAALRAHLATDHIEMNWLPDSGWIEVARSESSVLYVAEGDGTEFFFVTVEMQGGEWTVGGWGGCSLQPEIPLGAGLAMFRVAPHETLTPDTIEVDVLVTEMACNSGQDARGRILPPTITLSAESVTVVMTVRPRGGAQNCPMNPETPFLLVLPEPLGDRSLLDGSEIPPRDATGCPEIMCP